MIVNIVAGKSRAKMPPLYTVTDGTYDYAQSVAADGTVNWELALLSGSSATLTFSRVVDQVDVFLVGGGKPGTSDRDGGKGGGRVTKLGVAVSAGTPYTFTVGGSNANTTIFEETAATGGGANGGTGAVLSTQAAATKGGNGAYAFGESTSLLYSGRRYGAGGGGGGYFAGNFTANGATGGTTGGGHGGDRSHANAASTGATANTGSGGGGRGWDASYNKSYSAGAGGSGIIIIRNHR